MKIAFYCDHPVWGQLANNGGTRTILKSAETLRALGHEVDVIATKDKFTWFEHPPCKRTISKGTDWVIAASVSDVHSMRERCKTLKQAWWMRGMETWQHPKYKIIKRAGKVRTFVNSEYQKKWLAENGVATELLYPGYDNWKDRNLRGDKIRIGSLYSDRTTKQFGHFRTLAKELGEDYEFVTFGDRNVHEGWIHKHLKKPSHKELEELYSSCHIWFAPTKWEGLHNVPMEAALCGAHIICYNSPANGCWDYLDLEESFVYSVVADAAEYIRRWNRICLGRTKKKIQDVIGTREHNMKKLVRMLEDSHTA